MHYSFQMNSIVLCLILSTELLVSYFSMSIFYSFLFCTLTFFLFFVPGWLLFPPPLLFLILFSVVSLFLSDKLQNLVALYNTNM